MTEIFPILIAEDDENDTLILQQALRKVGFCNPFHISENGQDAMQYMKGEEPYTDRKRFRFPRILFTDLKMPQVDGFELLDWLQRHPECNVIPRIVLSASQQEDDIQRAYKLGVNSYLVKPPSFDQLVSMLRVVFDYWNVCKKPRVPERC
jgi:CheY-like chemotaxis protein